MAEQEGFFFTGGDTAAEEVGGGRGDNRRILMFAGGAVAILAIFLLLMFTVFAADEADPRLVLPRRTPKVTATTAAPVPPSVPTAAPDQALRLRDPFRPLAGGVAPDQPNPASPAPPATGGGTAPGGGSTPGPTPTVVVGGHNVTVLDVFTHTSGGQSHTYAQTRVDRDIYTPATGETFAQNFQLVSADTKTGCANYLFGDEPFQLCKR